MSGAAPSDREVLAALRAAGVDLAVPTDVQFLLRFTSREAAERAARDADVAPFTATVERDADADADADAEGAPWLCMVGIVMRLDELTLHAQAVRLHGLAQAHGGAYDGWDAALPE